MPQPNAGPVQQPAKQAVNDGVEQKAQTETPTGAEAEAQHVSDESVNDNLEFARNLNLPAEVTQEISKVQPRKSDKPKEKKESEGPADAEAEETKGESEEPEPKGEQPEAEEEEETPAGPEGAAEAHDEEEDGDEEDSRQPRAVKKLVRRNKSLTKRLRAAEAALQERDSQRPEQGQAEERAQVNPQGATSLQTVRTEAQLDSLLAQAEAAVDWCEENADGYEDAEKGFVDPKAIAAAKRTAEKVLRSAETRRRQIREYATQKRDFDQTAEQHFPKLFEKDSEQYKIATSILALRPWLKNDPAVHLMLGVWSDWLIKTADEQGKPAAGKNGQNGKLPVSEEEEDDDDLDERLTPEYQRKHIPPTPTPATKPPNRSITPSHLRKETVENITNKFTRPGGASVANLAEAFEAIDDDETRGRRKVAV